MTHGVEVELTDLIALKRYAQKIKYKPEAHITRVGNHLSKLRGRGMDFAEVRNYQAGDEIRHMEWRVTARTGRPHVKLYQEERERPVVFLTDFNPSMYFGTRVAFKSVVAAQLTAMIAWVAVKKGDRVGGIFFSASDHSEFTPCGREAGVLSLLASLTQYTNSRTTHAQPKPLSELLLRLRRVTRPGSIIVLVSDFYNLDKDCEQHLSRLRYHNDILAYTICDSLELSPPKPQRYAITNGQEDLILDTTNKALSDAYQSYCEHRIAQLRNQFQRLQIQAIQVTAEMHIPNLVRQTFPRGAT